MEEDKVVFRWELLESEFKQAIADNRGDIEDADAFWVEQKEIVLHYFKKAFAAHMEVYDVGMLINDAIDAVRSYESANE